MSKASVITLRVPHELKHRIVILANEQGVSINQFAMYALTDIVNQMEFNLITGRLVGKRREDVMKKGLAILDKVQDRPLPEWDKKPEIAKHTELLY